MNKQQSYYSKSHCKVHQEPYTNICVVNSCLQPLCPECIDTHYKEHKECQIQSLKQCRSDCNKKVKFATQQLNTILYFPQMETFKHPEFYIDQCEQVIEKFRNQLIKVVDDYLSVLKNQLQSQVSKLFKGSNIGEVHSRISALVQQLDELGARLNQNSDDNNDSQISTMKGILLLNIQQLVKSSNHEAAKEISRLKFPSISIQNSLINSLMSSLQESICIVYSQQQADGLLVEEVQQAVSQSTIFNSQQQISQQALASFQISLCDFFNPECSNKYLHFFKANSEELFLLNINNLIGKQKQAFMKIPMKCSNKVPIFHQSLITDVGVLYLLGGTIRNNNYPQTKSNKILAYNWNHSSLEEVGCMILGRSSFGCVHVGNYIYSISGLSQNSIEQKSCERYNCILRKSEQIQDCIVPTVACTCIKFNDEYIYKFGGLNASMSVTIIERFIVNQLRWEQIDPDISRHDANVFSGFTQFAAGTQLNDANIIIFGGYDSKGASSNSSFLLTINQDGTTRISQVDEKLLPIKEGFWNQQCIIQNGIMYALQNVEGSNNDINSDVRRILKFTSQQWQVI